ncbi:hypothetical protein [Bdellovibrio svalbardensis]|uniref:Lipoprotein n=1 Tax=Bdellovibrio svalbardensis TaxID=2972972 RepID=A0ABT6DI50_9BACT|nr:hypothetical protein [Bdellovibrio svalbardensis]MDG0815599.1 hypothetical protein [Bdellovibrio svalbardensis]
MKYLFALCLCLTACASYEVTPGGRAIRTESEYFNVIDQNSDQQIKYSGLYNLLDVQGTALNSKVMEAQMDQLTRIYQWDDKKYLEEKSKFEGRLNKETEFFVAFYTPERKSDDLNKPNTQWRLFLDVAGKRYEGKVAKIKTASPELISLYPSFNRFYTPYSVTFNVPMKSIESLPMKLTVTGSVGSAALDFKP